MGWLIPAIIGTKVVSGLLGDRANRKAQTAADRYDAEETARYNAYQQQQYEATLAEQRALAEAQAARLSSQLGVQSQSFGMLREAGEKEAQARANFAEGLEKFGEKTKSAHLQAAKSKRRAAARGAAKKGKGTGSISKAGRTSSAFSAAVSTAGAQGAARGTERAGKEAALMAYGADAQREGRIYGDLAAFGRQAGLAADQRRQLAGQYGQIMNPAIAAAYDAAAAHARLLGPNYLPPYVRTPDRRFRADNTLGQIFDIGGDVLTLGYGYGEGGLNPWKKWQVGGDLNRDVFDNSDLF